MAAVTTRLRFSNAVYIAPARPLLEVAKVVATAASLSEGRVSLGVGIGWMREEYELLGQEFGNRGKRLDEMIPGAARAVAGRLGVLERQHYQVPEMMIEPHPPQPVPILCGGESEAALRRAARLCDGWIGTAYTFDGAAAYVAKLDALRREFGRADEPFEIMLALIDPPSPELYKRAQDIGITAVMCAPWMADPAVAAGADVERYRGSDRTVRRNRCRRMPLSTATSTPWPWPLAGLSQRVAGAEQVTGNEGAEPVHRRCRRRYCSSAPR